MSRFFVLVLSVCLFFPTPRPAAAQPQISLSAEKNRIALNEAAELQVSVSGAGIDSVGEPEIEGMDHFDIVSTSQGEQLSIVNMAVTRSKTFSYVIRPKKAGETITLRAKITVGPDKFLSNRLEIATTPPLPGNAPGRAPSPHGFADPFGLLNSFGMTPPGKTRPRGKDDFILHARATPAQVYVGEELVYGLAFYRGADVYSNITFNPPQPKGFWVEQLPEQDRYRRETAKLGGRNYEMAELNALLYPLSAGAFTIPAGTVNFQPTPFSPSETVKSNELSVKVLPLPEKGKPADFSGLVGTFTIEASAAPAAGEAGKPLTLTITVSGKGNLQSVPRPREPVISGAEKYEPEIKNDFHRTFEGSRGARVFTYAVVPKTGGTLLIPPFSINYFNPKTALYETAATRPISVPVAKGSGGPAAAPPAPPSEKTETRGAIAGKPLYKSQALWAAALLLAVAAAGLKIFSDRKKAMRADERRARRLRAFPAAELRLQGAALKLAQRDRQGFFTEIEHALRICISDLYGIPPAAATPEGIRQKLPAEETKKLEKCLAVMKKCIEYRYAPSAGETGKILLEEARAALGDMEKPASS